MSGMGDILRLPLAWPPARKLDRRAAADAAGSPGNGFKSAGASLVTATYANTKLSGAEIRERNGKLEVHVVFDSPTEAANISPPINRRTVTRLSRAPRRPRSVSRRPRPAPGRQAKNTASRSMT